MLTMGLIGDGDAAVAARSMLLLRHCCLCCLVCGAQQMVTLSGIAASQHHSYLNT
jgi:hypothetical protein